MAKRLSDDEWQELRKRMWRFYKQDNGADFTLDTIEGKVDLFWRFLNKNESFKMDGLDGDCFLKFKQITEYLSSKFQQIPDVKKDFFCEVSKLACGGITPNAVFEAERNYSREFLMYYVEVYFDIIQKYQLMDDFGGIVLIRTYKYLYDDKTNCLELISFLLMSENAKQLLLGLKLLKIALNVCKKLRKMGIDREWTLILYNFQLISPDKHEGITCEIFNLVKSCFQKFNTPYDDFEGEVNPVDYIEKSSVETKRKLLYEILKMVARSSFSFVRIYEQYYLEKICMSAKTNDERIQYMEAILEVFDNHRRGQFRDNINNEFKNVVDHILYYLTKHFGKRSQEIEDKLRYIDKYHGIKIDPYGGPEILEDDVVLEKPVEEMKYIVEKCAVYDYFMRCLQILTILNTSFLRREEIYWICKGVKGDHKKIFRSNDIESYVCGKLSDKSKCGDLPWYIEMILRKCPFVVFEFPEKDIIDGLIKILKKEDVDEDLEKQIRKALNLDDDNDDD